MNSTRVGVAELTSALKRTLKSRGMTYAQLARELQLSEASVKRLFSSRTFTLDRIEAICGVLSLDFFDLARLAREHHVGESRLTLEQERGLAANPKLFIAFNLLLNDWDADDVVASYRITQSEWRRLLLALERLGLVALQGDEVRLRTAKRILWRGGDGPVRKAYQKLVVAEYFEHRFEGARALLRFEDRDLSGASVELIRRKIERLAEEYGQLAELDSTLKPGERTAFGLVLALRPYVPSTFTRYKRRRR